MRSQTAARRLRHSDVGMLVVRDRAGEILGVLTERDLVAAIAEDLDLDATPVAACAATDVAIVDADLSVLEAATTMAAVGTRHLLARAADGTLAAVSARDLVAVIAEQPDVRVPVRLP